MCQKGNYHHQQQDHGHMYHDEINVHLVVEGHLQQLALAAQDEGGAAVTLVELPCRG